MYGFEESKSKVVGRQEINLCKFGLTEDHIICWDLCLVGYLTMQYLGSYFFAGPSSQITVITISS